MVLGSRYYGLSVYISRKEVMLIMLTPSVKFWPAIYVFRLRFEVVNTEVSLHVEDL